MKKALSPLGAFPLLAIVSLSAFAQTAQLTGTVADKSGALVPGAKVTATNVATGVARSNVTNTSGNYLITALLPGDYKITTEAPGFKQVNEGPVTFAVDQVARIDFALDVGDAKESVSVSATAVLLDSDTSTVGAVIENKQVSDLPLSGRDPVNLLGLSPGIRLQSGFGGVLTAGGTSQSGAWSGFSFNGGIAGANPILVEGLSLDILQMNLPSYVPPVDATQEFRAQTDTFSAEYGRSTGAVINFSVKSGTNQFHGAAYEYLRNTDLNANTFFANRSGTARPEYIQNQYGGAFGGPIKKDKTFFFANFEEYELRQASAALDSVPTALQRVGNFSQTYTAAGALVAIADPTSSTLQANGSYTRQVFPGNIIPATSLSRVATNVAQLYPLPNTAGTPFTNTNNYAAVSSSHNNQQNGVGKFDHNLSERWKIFGTYAKLWDAPVSGNPWPAPVNFTRAQTDDHEQATLSATAVLTPRLIVELHTGFARVAEFGEPNSLGYDVTKLGFPQSFASSTQIQSFPSFGITGLTGIGSANSAGENVGAFNSWGQRGSLTWVKGSHTFKFGVDYRVQQMNMVFENAFEPIFNFTNQFTAINPLSLNSASGVPMASFMLGDVSTASAAKSPAFADQRKYMALFAQDDWKVSRRFTVNVGLNYSLEFPVTDRFNREMWFDRNAVLPISQQAGFPIVGGFDFATPSERAPADLYLRQWGPRLGFAYHLFSHTVIRSAYGLFWIPADLSQVVGSSGAPAWLLSTPMVTTLNGGVTPFNTLDNPFPQGVTNFPGSSQGANSLLGQQGQANSRSYHAGYMQQWNFDIQQQLFRNAALEVSYVGSDGVGLPAGYAAQINQLADKYLSLGSKLAQMVPNPYYGLIATGTLSQPQIQYSQTLLPFPQFSTLFDEVDPVGHSSYNAFQTQYKQRFANSLITVAYTISKAMGDTEARLDVGGSGNNSSGFMDNYNRNLSRSLSTYDIPQRFIFGYSFDVPFGKGKRFLSDAGAFNRVIAGWQLNGIYTAQSGTPMSFTSSTNLTGNYGSITDAYGTFVANSVPNVSGNAKLSGSPIGRLNEWFNTSLFSQPAAYTYGNAGRTSPNVRTEGTDNLDFSVFKNNPFGREERFNLQFRLEAFNVLNRVQFAAPGPTFGASTFGVISSQAGNPRQVQVALRLQF
jgi:Carboxypeptidase regulatory-like domain